MNTTTTTSTPTISFVSLYPFQGDRSENQLSFPPHTLIEVDATKQPNNGWIYGGYYHEPTTQFVKGWFPSSYVQRHQSPSTSASPSPSPSREQKQSRPRFHETIDVNLNHQNFNCSWPSNIQQLQTADVVMNDVHLHNTGASSSNNGFDSSSAMGSSTSVISSSRLLYRIDETGHGHFGDNDDVTQVTTNKIDKYSSYHSEDNSSNGFDVATNNIMGGSLPRSNSDGRTNVSDDCWGESNNKNIVNEEEKKEKSKLSGWFNQSFGLLTKNKRKVQPMMVSPRKKAKEPEWNAEPQIILPDGSIIEEYPTKKRGFLSFSQQFMENNNGHARRNHKQQQKQQH